MIRKKFEELIVLKMPRWAWHRLMWPMWEVRGGGSLPFIIPCFVFELYVGVLGAETLIGHCILLEKAMNMKSNGVIH